AWRVPARAAKTLTRTRRLSRRVLREKGRGRGCPRGGGTRRWGSPESGQAAAPADDSGLLSHAPLTDGPREASWPAREPRVRGHNKRSSPEAGICPHDSLKPHRFAGCELVGGLHPV